MSGAAPSGSIFRSTCNWPMTFFRRPSLSPRTWRRVSGSMRSSKKSWRSNCRASSPACHRWSLGLPSVGLCNTGSADPILRRCAQSLCNLVKSMGADANVRLVNFDWIEPSRQVRINIDQDKARLLGLSSQVLAEVLNTVTTGTPITQVRDNIYLVNVVTRANDEQRVALSTLRALQLPLPNGRTVPLSQDRDVRIRSRIPVDLAAPARADIDGAGRCPARRDPRSRGRGRSLRRSRSSTKACRKAITSSPVGPSRKARNRRRRSSPRCP